MLTERPLPPLSTLHPPAAPASPPTASAAWPHRIPPPIGIPNSPLPCHSSAPMAAALCGTGSAVAAWRRISVAAGCHQCSPCVGSCHSTDSGMPRRSRLSRVESWRSRCAALRQVADGSARPQVVAGIRRGSVRRGARDDLSAAIGRHPELLPRPAVRCSSCRQHTSARRRGCRCRR